MKLICTATIARAMIENASPLILDEATSSVDTKSELLAQEAMAKLNEGRTSFVSPIGFPRSKTPT